jgi:hypothetical protein
MWKAASSRPSAAPSKRPRAELYADLHIHQAKSLICTPFRWCYLNTVQTDSPLPRDLDKTELMETAMTLSILERSFDRIAPAFLLALGLLAAVATAGAGV